MSIETERVLSGFRPTSDLTLGNYFGAIKPALDIQDDPSKELTVFVADLHGLTDHHPDEIAPFRKNVVHDCLALGIDPELTTLYLQSDIEAPVAQISNRVSPYVSVAELARTPNLKEKLQQIRKLSAETPDDHLSANLSLLSYPVLMAADIFSQQAGLVAVGEDQEPHLEITRKIARRFNRAFGSNTLVEPRILAVDALRILSLDGKGKMSKSNPKQAILFTDDPDEARDKIRKATTASTGEWNPVIESHFLTAQGLATTEDQVAELGDMKERHLAGIGTMGQFKNLWAEIVQAKLLDFQERRRRLSEEDIEEALRKGESKAYISAQRVLERIKSQTGF